MYPIKEGVAPESDQAVVSILGNEVAAAANPVLKGTFVMADLLLYLAVLANPGSGISQVNSKATALLQKSQGPPPAQDFKSIKKEFDEYYIALTAFLNNWVGAVTKLILSIPLTWPSLKTFTE